MIPSWGSYVVGDLVGMGVDRRRAREGLLRGGGARARGWRRQSGVCVQDTGFDLVPGTYVQFHRERG